MRRPVLLAAFLFFLGAPAPAGAARVPCLPDGGGPSCRVWTGTVLSVNDGDTFKVDLDGDGSRRGVDVRFAGVQAMELTVHHPVPAKRRDECHGIEATARVEALVRGSGRRVRLTAQHASSRSDRRLARHVAVRRGGRWQDVGAILMAEGHTLFLSNPKESAWNLRYGELGQRAALAGRGLWNPTHCGAGPAQDVPLRIWAELEPARRRQPRSRRRVDQGAQRERGPLRVARRLVDPRQHAAPLHVPAGTVLAPGPDADAAHGPRVRTSGLTFHWGLGITLYPNPEDGGEGDGAYLFDPQGDLRAEMTYPCLVVCEHPDTGALRLEADPRHEAVSVRNVAGRPVDLADKVLAIDAGSAFPFGDGAVLAPGQALELDLAEDLGMDRPIMRDAGGIARIATFRDITLACAAWGSRRC